MNDIRDIANTMLEGRSLDELPSTMRRQEVVDVLLDLRELIALCYLGESGALDRQDRGAMLLLRIRDGLARVVACVSRVEEQEAFARADEFIGQLPQVMELLDLDIQAMLDGDPAAENKSITVLAYPGLFAIQTYRLAHVLYTMGIPMVPRIMSEYAHSETGIDINPGATVGKSFFIDHGTGIVIGETCVIGDNVKIYQGVTLGALSTRKGRQLVGVRRHPTIEDNVTIYAGACILGGETVVGRGSTIGGGTFIIDSVPPYSKISNPVPEMHVEHDERARAKDISEGGLFEIC